MYGLGKLKDVIETKHIGKVIRTHSKKFGYGNYLIIKANAKYFEDFMKFVKLPTCHVIDWDSMINDDVLEIMDFDFFTDYKSSVFVQHVEEHLVEMNDEEKRHGKVMCKICCGGSLMDEHDYWQDEINQLQIEEMRRYCPSCLYC